MKITSLVITGILLVSTISFANIEEMLDREQILKVFSSLKNQTRECWIPSGTIEGTHINIDLEAKEIVTTTEQIKYDNGKFRWTIDVQSHENLEGKQIKNEDTRMNAKRIFSWNGHEYSLYFKSSNNAIVSEDTSNIPVNVNGPLKAGVIPWGLAIYKVDDLAKNLVSAIRDADGKIIMKFKRASEYTMELKLDPAKDYAAESQVLEWAGKTRISNTCSDYVKYGKYWIPSAIITERTQNFSEANPTQSADLWQITSVNITPPAEDQFRAGYVDDTRVEYRTQDRVMAYRHKKNRDAEYMLAHRKYNASLSDRKDRNCATAALLYIASMFGKDVSTDDFDGLVTETDRSTSLLKMQDFLKNKELNFKAVKSNLTKLSELTNCQIILHLPIAKHYVILDHIDDKYAWIIDLDSDKFYYRLPISRLKEIWQDQTAMIISDKSITAPAGSTEIPEEMLHQIKGSTGGFGTYSCTELIQEYDIKFCSKFAGLCGGTYIIWYNRYGCKLDSGGGYCCGEKLVGSISTPCLDDMWGGCTSSGNWKSYYMRACY